MPKTVVRLEEGARSLGCLLLFTGRREIRLGKIRRFPMGNAWQEELEGGWAERAERKAIRKMEERAKARGIWAGASRNPGSVPGKREGAISVEEFMRRVFEGEPPKVEPMSLTAAGQKQGTGDAKAGTTGQPEKQLLNTGNQNDKQSRPVKATAAQQNAPAKSTAQNQGAASAKPSKRDPSQMPKPVDPDGPKPRPMKDFSVVVAKGFPDLLVGTASAYSDKPEVKRAMREEAERYRRHYGETNSTAKEVADNLDAQADEYSYVNAYVDGLAHNRAKDISDRRIPNSVWETIQDIRKMEAKERNESLMDATRKNERLGRLYWKDIEKVLKRRGL